jgi:hypothetical protein
MLMHRSGEPTTHLWQCKTFEDQTAWCRSALIAGHTLTAPGLWLGGADPDKVMQALRGSGMEIETCFVRTVDASNRVHPKTKAWRVVHK